MARNSFLVFSQPHFDDAEIQEIVATLKSGWVGTGPRAALFESEFSDYVSKNLPEKVHAIAMNSCTAALHIACVCLNLKPGDEVIVPSVTFGATANAVVHAGGTPVFVDIDEETAGLDPVLVERAITDRTKAVIVVHMAGRMAPLRPLLDLCASRKIPVIEDCAHAIETTLHDQHAGTFGIMGCFSFYATKNVSTGEGGMLITRDPELAARARKLSLHGMSKDAHKRFSEAGYQHYSFEEHGFKYNMPDLAAALGIHQLRKVEKHAKLRETLWSIYSQGLENLEKAGHLKRPLLPPQSAKERHALHLYQILVDPAQRDILLSHLSRNKIGVGVHYLSLVEHPIYQSYLQKKNQKASDFPRGLHFGRSTVSLPLGTAMTPSDAQDVIDALQAFFTKA